MTCRRGHNRRVITPGSLVPRLVVVALLALGLVGMHHLVVAACHHGASHAGHATILPTEAAAGHDLHDAGPTAPTQAPREAPAPAPDGLVGAAAMCLAVLIMVIGLMMPRIVSRLRRVPLPDIRPRAISNLTRVFDPPDLTLLSVSRT